MGKILDMTGSLVGITTASGQPITDLKAANLVAQTSAMAANVLAGLPSVVSRNPALAAEAAGADFAALRYSIEVAIQDYKAFNGTGAAWTLAQKKEFVGDVFEAVGDASAGLGAMLGQSPTSGVKKFALGAEAVGDGMTISGILLEAPDAAGVIWDKLQSTISDELNGAYVDFAASPGFQTQTSVNAWTSPDSTFLATVKDMTGLLNDYGSPAFSAAAATVGKDLTNTGVALSDYYDTTGLPPEDIKISQSGDNVTLTSSDPDVPPIIGNVSVSPDAVAGVATATTTVNGTPITVVEQSDNSSVVKTVDQNGNPVQTDNLPDGGSVVITTDADGTTNYVGYTGTDGTGAMTFFGQQYGDQTTSVSFFDPNTGAEIYSAYYDKNGKLLGETVKQDTSSSPDFNYNSYLNTIAVTAANAVIGALLPNDAAARIVSEAAASTTIGTVLGTADSFKIGTTTYTGTSALAANFGLALSSDVIGLVDGGFAADLNKLLNLPLPVGSITVDAANTVAAQLLTAEVAKDVVGVTEGLGVTTTAAGTSISINIGDAFEGGVISGLGLAAGQALGSLVVPQTTATQITSSLFGTIGTGIVLYFAPELAPLEILGVSAITSFVGDLIGAIFGDGYRGRAFSDGPIQLQNGRLVAGIVTVDNGGVASLAASLQKSVINYDNPLLASFGGRVTSTVIWAVGNIESNYFVIGSGVWPPPASTQVGNPNDAVAIAAFDILKSATFTGANPFMVVMLQKSDATTLQGLVSDLTAAYHYSQYVADRVGFDVSIALSGSATNLATWNSELARVQALGVDRVTPLTATSYTNTMAKIQASLATLESSARAGSLSSIKFTDSGTPTLTIRVGQATADAGAIAKITGTYNIVVSDTAANVHANLAALLALNAAGKLAAVALTDGGTLTVSAAQDATYAPLFARLRVRPETS